MNIKKNVIKDKIDIMLIVLKITIMLFGCIIVYQFLPFYWINDNSEYGYINTKAIGFVLISLILIYASWLLINIFMLNQKSKNKFSCIFEILFYITVISLPIYIFHDYQNKFKYVYLIVIIITIIQYGSGYGIMSALVSGIAILGVDLMYAPTVNNINSYFENDLVLIGVFIILAWILGYYVELVNEYKNEKEKQLKSLSSELEIQCTKRHKIEEMLFKNKMCFDMLFENAQKAIIVHKDDKIIYANQGAAKLLGQEAAIKLEKESIYNYYNEEIREEVKKKYHKIINEKISKQVDEEAILNSKGESIAVRNTSLFFIYEGEPSVLTFLLDVTTEKQLERLKTDARENLKLLNETREFNVLITEFFINISHEIKTPMNIIYMVVQSLEVYLNNNNIENKDKCSEYLKIMKQNCYRMIRLVNNLLDVTKFNSGFMKINKKNQNIVSVVEDIIQSTAIYIKSKNIEIIFDTNVEERIMAFDEDKIERIILNLLSNAFKYTKPYGNIMVNLEDTGSNVIITIKDDGEGISKENLELIFQRFGQANRSLSRSYEGSGIGLYLVKCFVEMHDGEITVESVENKGTEFKVVLPIYTVEDEELNKSVPYETNIERINIEFSDIYDIND